MCLSTAFKSFESDENLLCKYVSNADVEGETIVLYDVMGKEYRLEGTIKKLDLVKNIILIEPKA